MGRIISWLTRRKFVMDGLWIFLHKGSCDCNLLPVSGEKRFLDQSPQGMGVGLHHEVSCIFDAGSTSIGQSTWLGLKLVRYSRNFAAIRLPLSQPRLTFYFLIWNKNVKGFPVAHGIAFQVLTFCISFIPVGRSE